MFGFPASTFGQLQRRGDAMCGLGFSEHYENQGGDPLAFRLAPADLVSVEHWSRAMGLSPNPLRLRRHPPMAGGGVEAC